jgi:hypothetical protein
MWCWRRAEKISWTDRVRNAEVLHRVKEERNILQTRRTRKANWIGHIYSSVRKLCKIYKKMPFKAQWLLYVPPGLTFTNSTFCPHSVFMCFVWISEKTAIISLYSINWLVFVTETGSVYCAVRTLYTARFNIHKFYVLPTQCIYVFCADLRTNSDYFPIRH